jgi:hypothetical protein
LKRGRAARPGNRGQGAERAGPQAERGRNAALERNTARASRSLALSCGSTCGRLRLMRLARRNRYVSYMIVI